VSAECGCVCSTSWLVSVCGQSYREMNLKVVLVQFPESDDRTEDRNR